GDSSCYRFHSIALHQDQHPEIIVPNEREKQYRQSCEGRTQQRHNNIPENLELVDTLDASRLDQRVWQGGDEVSHEKSAETCLKREVEQDERPVGVEKPKAQCHGQNRNHKDLEANKGTTDKKAKIEQQ